MGGIYRYRLCLSIVLAAAQLAVFGTDSQAQGPELLTPQGPAPGVLPPLQGPGSGVLPQVVGPLPSPRGQGDAAQGEIVVDVRVAGNKTIRLDEIVPVIQTRVGRPLNERVVQEDIRRLNRTRKFINVRTEHLRVKEGVIVIFRVVERPTIQYVKYLGNRKISLRALTKQTELEVGQPLDPHTISEASRKMEEFYRSRGFNQVRIEILEGDKLGDQGAVFVINEGVAQKIRKIFFRGNRIATGRRLNTQIESRTPIAWFFKGFVDREQIDADVDRLTLYYRSLGFFNARISRELDYNEKGNWLTLTFIIDEGPRYKVREVSFIGHRKFRTEDLHLVTKLKPGDYFDQPTMNRDVQAIEEVYGGYGYIRAAIQAEPRFMEAPGELDLVYVINEGHRYRVASVQVQISGEAPHTSQRVVLNRLSLRPGDIIDIRELRASERRLKASGLFENDPSRGLSPRIIVQPLDEEDELADGSASRRSRGSGYRGQSPDPSDAPGGDRYVDLRTTVRWAPQRGGTAAARRNGSAPGQRSSQSPGRNVPRTKPQRRLLQVERSGGWGSSNRPIYRAQSPQEAPPGRSPSGLDRPVVLQRQFSPFAGEGNPSPIPRTNPTSAPPGAAAPPAAFGGTTAPLQAPYTTLQGNGVPLGGSAPGPNFGAPAIGGGRFAPPPTPPPPLTGLGGAESVAPQTEYFDFDEPTRRAIIIPQVRETHTGRFSVGAGINSDAGIVGTVVLDEQNFDITRWPHSFQDVTSGRAWRGEGQQFRIEAVPGSRFQRYTISFREPYLWYSRISFGISGFFFDRRFEDWDEQRLGGQVSLGYQLRPDLSATLSLRAENVNVRNPRFPTPPAVAAVLGDNEIFSARLQLSHDTRDSAFLPTEGHLLQIGVEQAFGKFDFPKADIDVRNYFLIHQRPDTSGRHVISVRGRAGFTGNQTPVFENYFAGGFSTLRGFDFRGASPTVFGTAVGGEFMLLGSVEYLLPLTADDGIRMVAFVDFGTVEESVKIDRGDFRVAPGLGLRIAVPGMGPAPIALDFAWAIEREATDDTRVFSFFVGLLR